MSLSHLFFTCTKINYLNGDRVRGLSPRYAL